MKWAELEPDFNFPESVNILVENKVFTPEEAAFEIIDQHTEEGQRRLMELSTRVGEVDLTQYKGAKDELLDLSRKLPVDLSDPEKVREELVARHLKSTQGISKKRIEELVKANPLAEDLAWLNIEAKKHGKDLQSIERDSRYIYDQVDNKLIKYIGLDAHRLLMRSRLLGLVPFSAVEKLQKLDIRSAGASAVMPTLVLLASMGAENMTWWDDGSIDVSNIPRLTVAGIKDVGKGKAQTLQRALQQLNPYGKFRGYKGIVVKDETEIKPEDQNITYTEFARGADYLLEVVDDALFKSDLRAFLRDNFPDTPLLYLADVGVFPFAGIEQPSNGNHFHQNTSNDQLESMRKYPKEIEEIPEKTMEGQIARFIYKLKMVVRMVDSDFPREHLWQLMAALQLMVPFWSQTPMASRESASVAVKLIMADIIGKDVRGDNMTAATAPRTLVNKLTRRQAKTMADLCAQLFYS